MLDWSLLCCRIIHRAATYRSAWMTLSRPSDGAFHTTAYAEMGARALKVAKRFKLNGIGPGDRGDTRMEHMAASQGVVWNLRGRRPLSQPHRSVCKDEIPDCMRGEVTTWWMPVMRCSLMKSPTPSSARYRKPSGSRITGFQMPNVHGFVLPPARRPRRSAVT